MLLYIIRHAEPTYDPDDLTPLGERQAEALARRLSVNGIDEVYTSPLNRARRTAQPTCELLHKQATVLEWTSEGLAFEQLSKPDPDHPGRRKWAIYAPRTVMLSPENTALGGEWYKAEMFRETRAKECWERIGGESDAFLEHLGYKHENGVYRCTAHNEKRVAVFCHHGFGTTWLAYLLGVSPMFVWSSLDLAHSSVTVLYFAPESNGFCLPGVKMISDISHIYADRLPMKYNGLLDI